jgi:thioredoxin reductase
LSNPRILPRYRTTIEEVVGEDVVTGARVRDLVSGQSSKIDLAGLFIYVGLKPNTEFLKNLLRLSDTGHVPTDGWMKTELPGIYAVGDIRRFGGPRHLARRHRRHRGVSQQENFREGGKPYEQKIFVPRSALGA